MESVSPFCRRVSLKPEHKPFDAPGTVYNLRKFQTVATSSDALEDPVVCYLSPYTDSAQADANEIYAVPLSQFLLNKVTPLFTVCMPSIPNA